MDASHAGEAVLSKNNSTCGIIRGEPLKSSYGPFDFLNPAHKEKLPIVLTAHFTPQVERLIRGQSSFNPMSDIHYTLEKIPNYHRALNSMSKYMLSGRHVSKPMDEFYSAECYFKRALYFRQDDAMARMLFAIHLHRAGKLNEAEKQYLIVLEQQPDNPELNYNLGLLYVEMGNISKAKEHAETAYQLKYPLPGLADKIKKMENSVN
ncbi:hypothetical protein GCM10009092_37370 [Bowmanella denitrificans]|uniref:Tetratricopeptide repeat protein n=2 Tax=Bowmanella denitrificans TaxID=366582 RepID=A0ABP3HFY1_9ALTE